MLVPAQQEAQEELLKFLYLAMGKGSPDYEQFKKEEIVMYASSCQRDDKTNSLLWVVSDSREESLLHMHLYLHLKDLAPVLEDIIQKLKQEGFSDVKLSTKSRKPHT